MFKEGYGLGDGYGIGKTIEGCDGVSLKEGCDLFIANEGWDG